MIHAETVEEPLNPTARVCCKVDTRSVMTTQPGANLFETIYRFRMVALTSPLWLGAVMILLNNYGSESVRAAIQFLAASPLR
jgi:hypothetical protein